MGVWNETLEEQQMLLTTGLSLQFFFFLKLKKKKSNKHLLCVCLWSEDNLLKLVPSFYHVDPWGSNSGLLAWQGPLPAAPSHRPRLILLNNLNFRLECNVMRFSIINGMCTYKYLK